MPSPICRNTQARQAPALRRRLRAVLAALYALQFGHLGIVLPFLAPWFQLRGFGPADIGLLMALPALCKMVAPWSWGRWADRGGGRKGLLVFAAALSAGALASLVWVESRAWVFAVVLLYGFGRAPIIPFTEATALEQSELRGFDYGSVRVWGSLAFAVTAAGFGAAAATLTLNAGLLIGAGMLAGAALVALAFPRPLAAEAPRTTTGGVAAHAPRFALARLFAACALMQVSHGAYYAFYSIRLGEAGYGGATIGWLWALAVVCEILMLSRVDRAVDRWGSLPVLRLSLISAVVRWLLIAGVDSLVWLAVGQTLHAFTYAAFHVAAIRVVYDAFRHARARGQALYSGMTYGLGMFVGSLAAGALADALGLRPLFVASAAVALVALIVLGGTPSGRPAPATAPGSEPRGSTPVA